MTEAGRFQRHEVADLSSAGLLRECGRKLTDVRLWQEFTGRFQRRIFLFLLRALRQRNIDDDVVTVANDLTQDVYLRLVRNDAHILRSFKGETDFAVTAFLGRVCVSVVTDYCRRRSTEKRQGVGVIPISTLSERRHPETDFDMNSVLSWIDVQRLIESDPEQRNAARNVLMFKLHYIDGLTFQEIAEYLGFNLTADGVEQVLRRMRARIRENIES
jgi:RNA polymerase sigma factor (sigma-70 family)